MTYLCDETNSVQKELEDGSLVVSGPKYKQCNWSHALFASQKTVERCLTSLLHSCREGGFITRSLKSCQFLLKCHTNLSDLFRNKICYSLSPCLSASTAASAWWKQPEHENTVGSLQTQRTIFLWWQSNADGCDVVEAQKSEAGNEKKSAQKRSSDKLDLEN